jgi:pimeloyl-ACP methyl ester carboxylesterase
MAAQTNEQIRTGQVISKDGTTIGYKQVGHGPGLVLVQGAMGTAQHFIELAEALAGMFTVTMPDRRGRGMSEPGGADYSPQKEVEDLDAVLTETGTNYVFGVSAGAIICLQSALSLPGIQRIAAYEPALFIDGAPTALVARYEQEMAQGKVAAALVTAMQAAKLGPPIFSAMPRWVSEPLTSMAMKSEDKKGSGGYVPMRELAPSLHYDLNLVLAMNEHPERFRDIHADVLLLGGDKSPAYLQAGLDALSTFLPHAKRITFAGLDHSAPWNADRGGKPEVVADALRTFFTE